MLFLHFSQLSCASCLEQLTEGSGFHHWQYHVLASCLEQLTEGSGFHHWEYNNNTKFYSNTSAFVEIIHSCNSEITLSNELVTSVDPLQSMCVLYDHGIVTATQTEMITTPVQVEMNTTTSYHSCSSWTKHHNSCSSWTKHYSHTKYYSLSSWNEHHTDYSLGPTQLAETNTTITNATTI